MYERILTALDGSEHSRHGGRISIALASKLHAELIASHVYSSELHAQRFRDMEPGLPAEYQQGELLDHLRGQHDSLIAEGFEALSLGYLEEICHEAQQAGVRIRSATPAGRNYVQLLALAESLEIDLLVLGAQGLGAIGDDQLGSTSARVLRHARCDVMICRQPIGNGAAILAGIDGSEQALDAAETANLWANALDRPLQLAAVYDTEFHAHVFSAMGHSLSLERQEQVGLAKQEDLHETLINDGLAHLYRGFLADAKARLGATNGQVQTRLLEGKAYRTLVDHARAEQAGLIVVARSGHHRQPISMLGSNAEAVCRLSDGNVLVVAGAKNSDDPSQDDTAREAGKVPQAQTVPPARQAMEWDSQALDRLQRAPTFVRPMARRMVEQTAREQGADRITMELFEKVLHRFGMGRSERNDD